MSGHMVTVADAYLPVTLSVPNLSDKEFREFCEQYPDYRLEYTADGDLIIMPPTDPETGYRNAEITGQLRNWARAEGRGIYTDSSSGYILPDGSRLSPDAAWISRERFRRTPTCPEFVIELLSPEDRRKKCHQKMLTWIANGALLGWMIDPRDRSVTVYRPNREPEVLAGVSEVAGAGPVEGFVLDLRLIWSGAQ